MTNCPGTRIKYLRSLVGMSQEELGRRVGVQRAAINKYEKGGVTNIPITTIEKIANVFEVSPMYIVGWGEEHMSQLPFEVRVLKGVERLYGNDAVELLDIYMHLNSTGQHRVLQYTEDMSSIYETETE